MADHSQQQQQMVCVCVLNSDRLGEFGGGLPGQAQTNNRAELDGVEAALQLAWTSHHVDCRVLAD